MIRLVFAALVSALGYLALLVESDWGLAWPRAALVVAVLIVAYATGLRGVVGSWRFPFLGFGSRPGSASIGTPSRAGWLQGPGMETRVLALVWGGAVVFRLLVLFHPPTLSNDLYRYLWDGRVLLSGTNPYRFPPSAPELAPLRDALWPLINNPTLPTIYPPLLMLLFAGVAAISPTVLAWKAVVTIIDLAAGFFIQRGLAARGMPRAWVIVYLWHPLPVIEFAGNGHADAVGLLLVALALAVWNARPLAAGTALALAGLVKFLPWVALPALLPRLRGKWLLLPLLVVAFYLPFQIGGVNALGSLGVFAMKWRSNDLLFSFLVPAHPAETGLAHAKMIAAGAAATVWLALIALRRPWPSVYAWTVGTLLLVSPVVHPWYVTWLLPALVFLPQPAWWVWSFTVFLAYAPLAAWKAGGVWEESLAHKIWEVAPVLALLPLQAWLETRAKPERDVPATGFPTGSESGTSSRTGG